MSRVTKIKDSGGNETAYVYDSLDRVLRITYPDDANEVMGY